MSMISAQINELRKWADQLSERENEFGVVVRALVAALRDAADTIWQLRDDLQRANAKNAKLRELCADMNKAAHMLCEAWEGSCSKEAEGMSLHAVCPISDTNELCVFGKLYDRVRELGVEASGDGTH